MWVAVWGVWAQQQSLPLCLSEMLGLLEQQRQTAGGPCLPPRYSKLATSPGH